MFERMIPRPRPGELVRIGLEKWRGRVRLDLRQHFTPDGAQQPGLLEHCDYEAAGLPLPPCLT